MKTKFLLDEHLSPRVKGSLLRRLPAVDLLRVGDPDAPPLGTLDPEILLYLETAQRALVTRNRSSIPVHCAEHFAAGRHHWGIFQVRTGMTIGRLIENLHLLWEASEAEEWIDQMRWLPF